MSSWQNPDYHQVFGDCTSKDNKIASQQSAFKNKKSFRKLNFNRNAHETKKPISSSYLSKFSLFGKHQQITLAQQQAQKVYACQAYEIIDLYENRKIKLEKAKNKLLNILDRQNNELEASLVQRDQAKILACTNSNKMKIGLATLQEKNRIMIQIKNSLIDIAQDKNKINEEVQTLIQYNKFILGKLQTQGDIVIDMDQQAELMCHNFEEQINHLVRQLNEEKKQYARQIKQIQQAIINLRINIKLKQDSIRQIKSKMCTMYIRMNSGSKSKDKKMSMSIKKFNNEEHKDIEQVFIGNRNFKSFSKQIIEKVEKDEELIGIRFYYNKSKQKITFQSLYKNKMGDIHLANQEENEKNQASKQSKMEQIDIRSLLSLKFYYKSKVVGVQSRFKSQKGNKNIALGNCTPSIQHELLTLVNKRIITISSFWHHEQMIGVGIWLTNKLQSKSDLKKKLLKESQDMQDYYG